jgi:hypothetical protein
MFHQKCAEKNIVPPCRCVGVLQACHKISRKDKALIYDERNVFGGCSGSNLWANYNPVEWWLLWQKLFPEDVKYLLKRKGVMCQRKRNDYELLIMQIKNELR